MKDKFKEKVQSMSAKEIILAMVAGLRNPVTKIDMRTFGEARQNGKLVCYGCAATNTIATISGIKWTPKNIGEGPGDRAKAVKTSYDFLDGFEDAIEGLRVGNISEYNDYAVGHEFAVISVRSHQLPILTNNYTEADLKAYVKLAEAQP